MKILSRTHLQVIPTEDDEVARLYEINMLDEKLKQSLIEIGDEIGAIPKNPKPSETSLTVTVIKSECDDPEKLAWIRLNFTEWMDIIDQYTNHSRKDGPSIFTGEPFARVEWTLDESVKTIADGPNKWDGEQGAFWIMDADGWFYWAEPLSCSESETASIGKVLKEVKLIKQTSQILDYYIDIHIEAINRDLSNFNNWLLPDMIGNKSEGSYNPGVSEEIRSLFISGGVIENSGGLIEIPKFGAVNGNFMAPVFCIYYDENGYLYGGGKNTYGHLCNGSDTQYPIPVKMYWSEGGPQIHKDDIKDIKHGLYTLYFLKKDGTWWASGCGIPNNILPTSGYPVQMMWSENEYFDETNVKKLFISDYGAIILKTDGVYYVIGNSYSLGGAYLTSSNFPVPCKWPKEKPVSDGPPPPPPIEPVEPVDEKIYESDIKNLVLLNNNCLMLRVDDNLWYGRGDNASGCLCIGKTSASPVSGGTLVPMRWDESTQIDGTTNIITLFKSIFLVKDDGSMWGAGSNFSNELTSTKTGAATYPIPMMWDADTQMNFNDIKKIEVGGEETYVLKNDGTWWAFGANSYGQLSRGKANGAANYYPEPAKWDDDNPMTEQNIADLRVGYNYARFQKKDSTWWAAGYNTYSYLVDGTNGFGNERRPYPVPMLWIDGTQVKGIIQSVGVSAEFPPAPTPDKSKTCTLYLNDDQSIKVDGFTLKIKEL